MQEGVLEHRRRPLDGEVGVHAAVGVAPLVAAEEADHLVGGPARVAHHAVDEDVLAADVVAVRPAARWRAGAGSRRPAASVTRSSASTISTHSWLDAVEGPVLLRRRAVVLALQQLHRQPLGDLHRAVGREGVDHQDLVGPQHRLDAVGDVHLLVEGGDDHRELGAARGPGAALSRSGVVAHVRRHHAAGSPPGISRRSMPRARPLSSSTSTSTAGEAHVALGDLEARRSMHQEAVQHLVDPEADDRLVGPGHADVAEEGGALRQHALVGGRHVGVGADHRADPAVEIEAQRLLLAGRLGVEVDEDHLHLRRQRRSSRSAARKGESSGLHEHLPLEVDHRHRHAGRASRRRERRARGCRPGSWPGAGCAASRVEQGRRPPSCPRCGCRR